MDSKIYKLFQGCFPDHDEFIAEHQELTDNALKLTCKSGIILYFIWYSDAEWMIGTEESIKWLLRK